MSAADKRIPEALITLGIIGVFATAFLTAEGTVKALGHIQDAKDEKFEKTGEDKLTPKETICVCTKDFVPAATAAAITTA